MALSSGLGMPILASMEPQNSHLTWVEVDLSAIRNNVRDAAKKTKTLVMVVVKANGYGHGAVPVAKASLDAGATGCAVARIDEALELRHAGMTCPILLFGQPPPGRYKDAIAANISMAFWDGTQVQQASSAGRELGLTAKMHLKVDTGMSRLGVKPEEALALTRMLTEFKYVTLEGVFTHFARADEVDMGATDQQMEIFTDVIKEFDAMGLRPPLVHAANSATTITSAETHFDMIRLGIALYGLHPSADWPLPPNFRPALSWKTQLVQVKELPPGRGISYGHEYITSKTERVGTVPVGYADGLRWGARNSMLVGGQKVSVIGRVCMDYCMVNLDDVPQAEVGDQVVLIGEQGGSRISAEQVAKRWDTINYEVTCGIGARVPRFYLGD